MVTIVTLCPLHTLLQQFLGESFSLVVSYFTVIIPNL